MSWRSRESNAEFSSWPVAFFTFTLKSSPRSSTDLARTSPSQGRYAKLFLAAVVYFAYYNGIAIARQLVERGDVPSWIGVWPVHAVLALAGIWMLSGGVRMPSRLAWSARRRAAPR